MQRTQLYIYLEKVAQGDQSYNAKLCQQLADRLIYVPILERSTSQPNSPGKLKVRAVRLKESGSEQVLLFTTERLYKSWAVTFPEKTSFISLLGGDFCAALQREVSVVVDAGTACSVVLTPELVQAVADSSPEEEIAPAASAPQPGMAELRGRSEPTSFMQRPKVTTASSESKPATQINNALPAPESTQIYKPSNSGLFGGAFSAGSADRDESSNDPNDVTATQVIGDRPVIFSPDSDSNRVVREKEDPSKKKRKSFLKFLKGTE